MFYDLAATTWGEEERRAIEKVLRSGNFTMGENVAQFEKDFAAKFKTKYALMVNSGSSANLIGVAALFYKKKNPLRPGDEVIVPAVSWATTYYPLQQYGLKLRFIDVEIDSLNMDTSKLEKALTRKTKMVVGVNVLGNPCDLTGIRKFCNEHNLYFFEDNCESMGAELDGKLCGTFGDLGTFSTFFSHHISTIEGGVLATDNEELYHLCLALRAHGWTRELSQKTTKDFPEEYDFVLPGYNARPNEIAGATGICQLKKLDVMLALRRENAQLFQQLFAGDERFIIQKENGKSSWFSFSIVLNPKYTSVRSEVLGRLRNAGIGFRMVTGGNFLRHEVIKYFNYECVGKIKNADIIHDRGFFVGNHHTDLSLQLRSLRSVLDLGGRIDLVGLVNNDATSLKFELERNI